MISRFLLLVATLILPSAFGRPALSLETLEPRPRQLLVESLAFADRSWDEEVGLLRSPAPGERGKFHRTRESVWYALGLLIRQAPGDESRAVRILDDVLNRQFDAPGQPWDGTFHRAPEEPVPTTGAQLWKNFDPNWRQFIGSTFVIVLTEFEPRLPAALCDRMRRAIRRAVESELVEGRAEPYHTNIALMHGFLLNWAGVHFDQPEWVARSEAWADRLHADFTAHETFDEYNSPTYYGVDLYGLALWRRHGATEKIRALGAAMEAGLWRDIARFYHAGLRNLCGPFDRAYGLDMRRYVSLTGIWMGFVLEADQTPLPDPAGPMGHAHDFLCTPNYVALGAAVPAGVLPAFRQFEGERQLERVITPERTATAWLSDDLMLGGELTGLSREAGPGTAYGQFHPATIHWRVGARDVGAVALWACPKVDARATPHRLGIVTERGDATFRIAVAGLDPSSLKREAWGLPNLQVTVDTDASGIAIEPGDGFVDVTYRAATRIDLGVTRHP